MASDRMMEYYYSMGQDTLAAGDIDEAVTYFRKAANLGAGEAAHEIGVIGRRLEKGDGLEKDEEKAAHCYRLCGEMGDDEAWLYLGKLYLRGLMEESRIRGKPNVLWSMRLRQDIRKRPFFLPGYTMKVSWGRLIPQLLLSTTFWQHSGEIRKPCL